MCCSQLSAPVPLSVFQTDGSVVNGYFSTIDFRLRSQAEFRWCREISETVIKCFGDLLLIPRDTLLYI